MKDVKILFTALILLILFLLGLSTINKQQIYSGSVFIQEYINSDGDVEIDLFLLSENELNIDLIDYIILETNQGDMFVYSKYLEYSDSLIKICIENIGSVKYPKNNVLIYGEQISLLEYLLSNIF